MIILDNYLLVEGLTFMLHHPSQFVSIGHNYVEGIAFRRSKLFEISSPSN